MTALANYAVISNIVTGAVVASTTEIDGLDIHTTIDSSGSGSASFRPGSAFCDAVVDAWGGPTYQNDSKAYLLDIFEDGGTKPSTSMWIETGSINFGGTEVGVTISGKDIADGFDRSYIDDSTYIDCLIEDVLRAAPGAVRINPTTSMVVAGFMPIWWEGIFNHSPGKDSDSLDYRFKFDAIVSSRLQGNRVDTNINTDSIHRSATNVLASASAVFDPAHPELFGADQHFSYDVPNRKVWLGHRNDAPVFTLRGDKRPSEVNETIEAAIVDGDSNKLVVDLAAKFAQTEFKGGSSTHGMPDGGTFTGCVMVNKPASGTSTGEYDNLLVVSITTGSNAGGGVYILLHDNVLRRMSQAMDVTYLTFDGTANILYAATTRGVFFRDLSNSQFGRTTWQRLGGDNQNALYGYSKVWVPASGIVYAVASGSDNGTGVNGLYRWQQSTGWRSVIRAGTLTDASGSDSELYYTSSNAPDVVNWTTYPTVHEPKVATAKGPEHIVGMDFDSYSGDVIVRTELGATAMYRLRGGSLTTLDSGNTLADTFGPLEVAEFIGYTGPVNGVGVNGFVLTDRGLWWRKGASGPFFPTDGQNGIQNVSGQWLAVGSGQTIMGRPFVPVAVLAGNKLYLSRDGGLHFEDVLAQSVDGMAAWFEAMRQFTGHYPQGDEAAFGSGGVPTNDPQGTGKIVINNVNSTLALKDGWICARRWTANNTFTLRLLDLNSTAPYNATRPAELVEIAADDSRSLLDASSAVLTGMYRFLAQASRPMFTLQLTSTYATQESALRTCINGDTITVDYYVAYVRNGHTSVLCDLANVDMILIDKHIYDGPANERLVDLVLVNDAAFALLDLQKIVAGIANGQAKDRRKAGVRIR